jgi:hypothetical protein
VYATRNSSHSKQSRASNIVRNGQCGHGTHSRQCVLQFRQHYCQHLGPGDTDILFRAPEQFHDRLRGRINSQDIEPADFLQILSVWTQRKVVEKQAGYNFYRPAADALSALLCDIPSKFFTSLIFNTCLYFMANLRRTASAYFIYLLFSFVGMMTMSMFFRCVGSLARTITQTMVPFGVTVILFITYTGFVIPVNYMHGWLRWVRYLNPLSYSFESLMINEVSPNSGQ